MERRTIVQIPSMASLNNEGASFSSSTHRWEYDVFLSFRGEDTREGFTSHLYKALSNKGINTFFDDIDLPRGEEISEKLIQAIKNSSILVIVFSENYAESKWCLDELAEIVKCREEDQEVKIRPIFYNVDPSEIRNQKGKFGRELDEHEEKFKNNKDKVQRWRDALEKAAKAAGWHYKKGNATCKSESQFIQYIVEEISNAKSNRMSLYVAEYPVGINSRAEAIESLLDIGEVVRQQAPDILEKRSRLYCYKDSLEVLTRNKGSENIRGIMLHSPRSVKVQLHTEAFRRMENLKFLIVKNVHICKPLKFLPHSLIFLKWPNYPFHWPSEYFPEQLVAIEMPNSCIRLPKLISQERRLENLTDVNLCGCEFITKLPKLWAPNLENLNLSFCQNLVEIDEYFGSLEKLEFWDLDYCRNLQILPSQLRLKSLRSFYLHGCSRLEKLPNFHPEMECLKALVLSESGIREVPSSIEHLTKLEELRLDDCKNLRDLPDSIYKLQQLPDLWTPTAKLRPTRNSFDGSSGYGFVNMTELVLRDLDLERCMFELDLLMKPDYFPALKRIDLSGTNIVTIPESISRFPRLEELEISYCKLLHEIQGLPQSIRRVNAEGCMLLDTQSPSGLLNQVIEIIGILPSRVCGTARSNKLMDPQLTNYFPSETEGAESEDGDISMDPQFSNHFPSETEDVEYEDWVNRHEITCCGTEMPKWVNHQSVDNSIFFFVGRKFPKLVVCIVAGKRFDGTVDISVDISINGYKNHEISTFFCNNTLFLFSPTQRSLQRRLNESNPTDQNLVEVSITYNTRNSIKRWGVHVECTCPPREDDAVDYGDSLMHLFETEDTLMNFEEICLNQKITLKLFLLYHFGPVSFAFDAKKVLSYKHLKLHGML
ncbi:hypothetical protein CMV_026376 [Castanea mollissima]|uniref:TIR domain-containing protein n=1 Tax=Castanea mollissima TaxID=60419 RepID=A0A8J4QM30_9ROSI|nr:hypothetical protein CMV_026376 [Castanea mollissima]